MRNAEEIASNLGSIFENAIKSYNKLTEAGRPGALCIRMFAEVADAIDKNLDEAKEIMPNLHWRAKK